MQPFVNPNYFNPYPMYQQPQIQPQMPSYAQNIVHNGLEGKYVGEFSEVTANDVPMTGQGALFIKGDLSEIQLRNWNANGLIDIKSFKPSISEVEEVSTKSVEHAYLPSDELRMALENINDRLDKMEGLLKRKPGRKEVAEDD